MNSTMIELDKGQLTWVPKTIIFEGKEYKAPIDLLPILVYRTAIEFLLERKQERNKFSI